MKLTPVLVFVALLPAAHDSAAEPIVLYYNERIPYLETQANGEVGGLTATPARLLFQRAGIAYVWKKAPAGTQVYLIRENREPACLVGWYKNPEREKLGKYTHPIYQGLKTVALTLAGNGKLGNEMTVADLLQKEGAVLLIKEMYSYGQTLDALIRRYQPHTAVATGENINMLHMLIYKRTDYFFIGEEEALELMRRSGYPLKDFKLIRFSEPLYEDPRHLWCSKQVPDSVIEKLDAAIDQAGH
ncbi:MAG: hypothetical protein HYZ65_08340 [Burkholderiales bacterium]|nr:hypothetical protein [Burkholderiales bacterium]